jgi:hypothetical protein
MAEPGDKIFVVMWPRGGTSDPRGHFTKLPDAQYAITSAFPECLRQHFFWNNDGNVCRLLTNVEFPYPLPYVKKVELV